MKKRVNLTPLALVFFSLWAVCLAPSLYGRQSVSLKAETGYVTTKDGVRLYYSK